jgi:hypothetical protein
MWALCAKLGCCVRISLEPLLAAAPKDDSSDVSLFLKKKDANVFFVVSS